MCAQISRLLKYNVRLRVCNAQPHKGHAQRVTDRKWTIWLN